MEKVVIFGVSPYSQLLRSLLEREAQCRVVAFTVDEPFITAHQYEGLPVYPFHLVQEVFPPDEFKLLIGVGYSKMNQIREQKFIEAKNKGYSLFTYISRYAQYHSDYAPGENVVLMQGCIVQPYVKISDNVVVFAGSIISHHTVIGPNVFIAPGVKIAGNCNIGANSFLGIGSVILNSVRIAKYTLVGAGCVIQKDTEEYGVYVPASSSKIDKKSYEIHIK